MNRWVMAGLIVAMAGSGLAQTAATNAAAQKVTLADAPANTWVKAVESATGGRDLPLFVYVPTIKKFMLSLGMQSTGGAPPRHYDTEEFDLAAGKWINAKI